MCFKVIKVLLCSEQIISTRMNVNHYKWYKNRSFDPDVMRYNKNVVSA